ncbi:MAG: hypothetical protein ACOX0E_05805 [Syntrophomonadaceae bacterium]
MLEVVKKKKLVNNCYRAILAQVNYLDSVYRHNSRLKELYEELTVLALYIMEGDNEQAIKGIIPLKETLKEIACSTELDSQDMKINLIMGEIKTHLDYLLIAFSKNN